MEKLKCLEIESKTNNVNRRISHLDTIYLARFILAIVIVWLISYFPDQITLYRAGFFCIKNKEISKDNSNLLLCYLE